MQRPSSAHQHFTRYCAALNEIPQTHHVLHLFIVISNVRFVDINLNLQFDNWKCSSEPLLGVLLRPLSEVAFFYLVWSDGAALEPFLCVLIFFKLHSGVKQLAPTLGGCEEVGCLWSENVFPFPDF